MCAQHVSCCLLQSIPINTVCVCTNVELFGEILTVGTWANGHFGDVHKATFKNKPVAVKTCKATVDAATRRKFLSEAYILKNYNHPNIVKLIGVATDRHPIYIVMELVQGGDLLKLLRDDSKTLSVPEKIKMSEDAASGMAYLEGKSCIH
ncbi:putative tyrosine-protein kinase, partial [Apostichopus japonicus]